MNEIWIIAVPILLVDVLNPVLFAIVVLQLTGAQPILRSTAVILGHSCAYLVFGLLVMFGLAEIMQPLIDRVVEVYLNPVPFDFVVGLLIGVALIAFAMNWIFRAPLDEEPKQQATPDGQQSLLASFMVGVSIKVVGVPFALPYYGFISELFRTEVQSKVAALIIYNILYALPFALLPIAFSFWGANIIDRLEALNVFVARASSWLLPRLFALLGLVFVIDAIKYFLTGNGLI